jgi:hypothetical protein
MFFYVIYFVILTPETFSLLTADPNGPVHVLEHRCGQCHRFFGAVA